jgi:putative molybdopterin biosynthesis protein
VQTENMTVKEVADFLRVSRQTVYTMVKQGKIPCFRVGTKVRFKRGDVIALTQTQTQTQTKPVTTGVEDE